jgi:hypothetical protein
VTNPNNTPEWTMRLSAALTVFVIHQSHDSQSMAPREVANRTGRRYAHGIR